MAKKKPAQLTEPAVELRNNLVTAIVDQRKKMLDARSETLEQIDDLRLKAAKLEGAANYAATLIEDITKSDRQKPKVAKKKRSARIKE